MKTLILILCVVAARADELEKGFASPPASARPWVYWMWMNGNLTREGITKDLEEMNRVGIGGVLILSLGYGMPPGRVGFMSAEWRALFQHMLKEAARLGIEVDLNNGDGWAGSGGPWIKPEQGMQMLAHSTARVQGPGRVEVTLPKPMIQEHYEGKEAMPSNLPPLAESYRDIAVLAYPTPTGDEQTMRDANPKVTVSDPKQDATRLVDGKLEPALSLASPTPEQPAFATFEFKEPFTARALTVIAAMGFVRPSGGTLLASDDGRQFREVCRFQMLDAGATRASCAASFSATRAKFFRVQFNKPVRSPRLQVAEVELHGGARIDQYRVKAGYQANLASQIKSSPDASKPVPPDLAVQRDKIVNLTAQMDRNGKLAWDAPAGNWTVMRLGHASGGICNRPPTKGGQGLECDKLSKEAIEAHFNALIGRLITEAGPFAFTHVDSWENGSQNWTPRFRDEFIQRRGYDPLPFLPAMTGRVVDSLEISERFLHDVRRTIADLIADNYFGHLRELANRRGMKLSIEHYGKSMLDTMMCGGRADMPMGEFWANHEPELNFRAKLASSAGHVYGKPIIGAESFTEPGNSDRHWAHHPFSLKAIGDVSGFCSGVNRFMIACYTQQPWTDKFPGMTIGSNGIHFERTQTWWEQSRAWLLYLARCQYLLQKGKFVADTLHFYGEQVPNSFGKFGWRHSDLDPPLPEGYDFDACGAEVLLQRVSVSNGRLVLPDGMSYAVLTLPNSKTMTLPLLKRIKELVAAGATVIGPKPERAPGLTDYPNCDREVQKLADEFWGKVITNKSVKEVLSAKGLPPDFSGANLHFIHRKEGDTDIYFVANPENRPVTTAVQFRIRGKQPEFWHPDTGKIERVADWQEKDGRAELPLHLDPRGSVFVVFREPASALAEWRAPDDNRNLTNNFTMACWAKTTQKNPLPREGQPGAGGRRNYAVYPPPGHELYGRDHAGAGIAVTANGVCVLEHSAGRCVASVVVEHQSTNWTHVAAVYRDRQAHLFINGKLVRTGARSDKVVHSGVGVTHKRETGTFAGSLKDVSQFERALTDAEVAALVQPERETGVPIGGPWTVDFQPGRGAPASAKFDKLASWSEHTDAGIKYFSGTATYRTTFQSKIQNPKSKISLDLGRVEVMAEVRLNGRDLGILWKPPFRVEITDALKQGENTLEIKVVNLWVNRLIGDEQYPDDCAWRKNGVLEEWPAWLLEGRPRPVTNRITFTTWKHWHKNDKLLPSGLLGPVTLQTTEKVAVSLRETK